jgi:hypothetical protein
MLTSSDPNVVIGCDNPNGSRMWPGRQHDYFGIRHRN